MRFLIQIAQRVRDALPPDRVVGVKINSADFQRGGFDEDDAMVVSRALEAVGVDFIEVSGGNYESPAMMGVKDRRSDSTRAREAYFADFSSRLAAEVSTPILLTGGLRSGEAINEVLAAGCSRSGWSGPSTHCRA